MIVFCCVLPASNKARDDDDDDDDDDDVNDCLDDKGPEYYYQNCSVLYCVLRLYTQSYRHS